MLAKETNVRNTVERLENEPGQYYSIENNGFLFFFIKILVPGSGRNGKKEI